MALELLQNEFGKTFTVEQIGDTIVITALHKYEYGDYRCMCNIGDLGGRTLISVSKMFPLPKITLRKFIIEIANLRDTNFFNWVVGHFREEITFEECYAAEFDEDSRTSVMRPHDFSDRKLPIISRKKYTRTSVPSNTVQTSMALQKLQSSFKRYYIVEQIGDAIRISGSRNRNSDFISQLDTNVWKSIPDSIKIIIDDFMVDTGERTHRQCKQFFNWLVGHFKENITFTTCYAAHNEELEYEGRYTTHYEVDRTMHF